MAKIKHIAIATQDEEATAKFYIDAFGLTQVGKINLPIVSGYFLSDGSINLAILHFKDDQAAGVERGKQWSGLHHIGFEVENVEDTITKLTAAGASPRDDINGALGAVMGAMHRGNAEMRYRGPDNVNFDISQSGWVIAPGVLSSHSRKE